MHGNQQAQISNCTVPEYDGGILYESEAANQGSLRMHMFFTECAGWS
jgi:hypothetical protein